MQARQVNVATSAKIVLYPKQVFRLVSDNQTTNMATTYFQDCLTCIQKKIYGAVLQNPKVKNNPIFEKPFYLTVAGYIGYFFLFMIGTRMVALQVIKSMELIIYSKEGLNRVKA